MLYGPGKYRRPYLFVMTLQYSRLTAVGSKAPLHHRDRIGVWGGATLEQDVQPLRVDLGHRRCHSSPTHLAPRTQIVVP